MQIQPKHEFEHNIDHFLFVSDALTALKLDFEFGRERVLHQWLSIVEKKSFLLCFDSGILVIMIHVVCPKESHDNYSNLLIHKQTRKFIIKLWQKYLKKFH